jgi:large subunit ribosomal protein L6
MSRLAKKPILIPAGVTVTLTSGSVKVKGPQGELSLDVRPEVKIEQADSALNVSAVKLNKKTKALPGTYVSHLKNMLSGVTKKFEKKLILEGVGYKSDVKGKNLVLALGFSHPVDVAIPEGLTVTAEKNLITIQGVDKELVGQYAAKVRDLKKPEPYKGKGFRYETEVIRRKQGKKSV